jgi:hypothetical protein
MELPADTISVERDGSLACPKCAYSLTGLPLPRGVCPECGAPYRVVDAPAYPPLPVDSALLRLGWPLIGLILSIALGYVTGGVLLVGLLFFVPALFINTPIMVIMLTRRHLPPQRRSRSFVVNVARLGVAPVVLMVLNVLAMFIVSLPLVALGACLISGP